MLAKFSPIPLPAAWFRHTPVKSMNPIGVMYALPILNESGALSSTGAAGAGAGATTGVVVTGSVVAGGGCARAGDAMASASSETRRERFDMPPTLTSARGASVTAAKRSARARRITVSIVGEQPIQGLRIDVEPLRGTGLVPAETIKRPARIAPLDLVHRHDLAAEQHGRRRRRLGLEPEIRDRDLLVRSEQHTPLDHVRELANDAGPGVFVFLLL